MGVTRKEKLLKAMLSDNAEACRGGVTREERILASVSKKVCDNDALEGGGTGGGGSGGGTANFDGVLRYDAPQELNDAERKTAAKNMGFYGELGWDVLGQKEIEHELLYSDNGENGDVISNGETEIYRVDSSANAWLEWEDISGEEGKTLALLTEDGTAFVARPVERAGSVVAFTVGNAGARGYSCYDYDENEMDGYTFDELGLYLPMNVQISEGVQIGGTFIDGEYKHFVKAAYHQVKKIDRKYLPSIVLTSPDGTEYVLTVSDDGTLSAEEY